MLAKGTLSLPGKEELAGGTNPIKNLCISFDVSISLNGNRLIFILIFMSLLYGEHATDDTSVVLYQASVAGATPPQDSFSASN